MIVTLSNLNVRLEAEQQKKRLGWDGNLRAKYICNVMTSTEDLQRKRSCFERFCC